MGKWDEEPVPHEEEPVPHLPATCQIFASGGAGDDWADIPTPSKHGITYCNGARASNEAVADMAIWHILSGFRNLIWSAEAGWHSGRTRTRTSRRRPSTHAADPKYTIAQKAHLSLGMKVLYHDVVRKSAELEDAVKRTFYAELDDMLAVTDCVVLATPFFGSKLVTAGRLQKFKKGSRFVNIARGTLVDENVLVGALKSGHIFAAGLDVYQNESHVHPEVCDMRNVTLTCRNAGGRRKMQQAGV